MSVSACWPRNRPGRSAEVVLAGVEGLSRSRREGWGADRLTGGAVGLQKLAQVQKFHAPEPLIGHFKGQALSIWCQRQSDWITPSRKRQGMDSAVQTISDNGKPAWSMLCD